MRVPGIIIGQNYKGFHCVCHDDYGAAYALTKLMLEKGRRKPGFIGVTIEDKAAGQARRDGFTQAVLDAGLTVDENSMIIAEFSMESGYKKAAELCKKEKSLDCIFCATDAIAAGTMRYYNENHIRIPEDILLAAVGDSEICKAVSVPLTSARLHYKTSGIEAANMLLTELKRRDSIPKVMCLDFEIVERTSTFD